jgi:hypothetical protein
VLDPTSLIILDYSVDHRLTITEGFYRGKRQVPWQYICHPANLQMLTKSDNSSKYTHSDISPRQLMNRIRRFETKFGRVLLPGYKSTSGDNIDELASDL